MPFVADGLHTGNSWTPVIAPRKEKLEVTDELLFTGLPTWRETWREKVRRSLAGGKSLCVNRGEEHSRRWAEMILFEGGRVHRLIALPAFPYPAPIPIANAEHYYAMPRIIEKLDPAEQKELFREWTLRVGWTHTDSVDSLDSEPRCSSCGSTFFDEDAKCQDCGEINWEMLRSRKPSVEEEASQEAEKRSVSKEVLSVDTEWFQRHNVNPRKGHKKVRLTSDEFVLGALLAHSNSLLHYGISAEEWQKLVNTYRILCGELVPRDIANETGESLATVEKRCETITAALRRFSRELKPRPIVPLADLVLLDKLLNPRPDTDRVVENYAARFRQSNAAQ